MSAIWYMEKASKCTSAAGLVTILNALEAVPKIFMCHLLLLLGSHPWFSAPTPHSLSINAPFPHLYFQERQQWKRVTHFLFSYRIVCIVGGHRNECATAGSVTERQEDKAAWSRHISQQSKLSMENQVPQTKGLTRMWPLLLGVRVFIFALEIS